MKSYKIDYISELESESIFIIREVLAQFNNPVILFSGGKDSIILTHLAKKAVYPSKLTIPLVHIDTSQNFTETIRFRDNFVKKNKLNLVIGSVQESIEQGRVKEDPNSEAGRNYLQSVTLLDTIKKYKIDCAIGGARREEEKSRAKERIFSLRDAFGQWNPKFQRPELWNIFNGRKFEGEHFRVFPLSNWTELDIWNYLHRFNVRIPSIYFSHLRKCVIRNNFIVAYSQYINLDENEKTEDLLIRCRTVGDMTCTGLIESKAKNTKEIIKELKKINISERGYRIDDFRSPNAMEERKRLGYF